jgi:YesN/AraC family two-component response regulator
LSKGKDHFSKDDIILGSDDDYESVDYEEQLIKEDPQDQIEKPIVLIVEDNKDVIKFVSDTLKDNYIIYTAANGKEGLEKSEEMIPDIIISDIMMPEMDGNEMCRLIKQEEKTSHIPVILLTAKAADEDRIEGLETGADDYIIKPFNAAELSARMKNLINQRQTLREKYLRQAEINPVEVVVNSTDKAFIEKAITLIEKNISNPDFGLSEFAGDLAMSRSQLYRKFKALLGEQPSEFIRKYRLRRGAELIRKKFGNISEIAYEVGFSQPAYFAKCFKKLFGMNPHEYEQKELNKHKV